VCRSIGALLMRDWISLRQLPGAAQGTRQSVQTVLSRSSWRKTLGQSGIMQGCGQNSGNRDPCRSRRQPAAQLKQIYHTYFNFLYMPVGACRTTQGSPLDRELQRLRASAQAVSTVWTFADCCQTAARCRSFSECIAQSEHRA
jgi:hypothetical protein